MREWMKHGAVCCAVALLAGCALETTDDPREEVAASTDALSRPALNNRQEATVLKLIDDICGDTWCEGDNNFRFDRLECHAGCAGRDGSCRLTFRVFSYDTDVETGPTYTRSCTTSGFRNFDSLVKTSGSYQSLAPAYYDALTECISREEAALPR